MYRANDYRTNPPLYDYSNPSHQQQPLAHQHSMETQQPNHMFHRSIMPTNTAPPPGLQPGPSSMAPPGLTYSLSVSEIVKVNIVLTV